MGGNDSIEPRHTVGADGPYWQALAEGRLELPRCEGCNRWHWPAVFRCGECGSWDHRWHTVATEGTIFSWTRTWHPFDGSEGRSEEHTSELQSLMRISYAVFCLKKKIKQTIQKSTKKNNSRH